MTRPAALALSLLAALAALAAAIVAALASARADTPQGWRVWP